MLLFSFALLLILNIMRIFTLSLILGSSSFGLIHKIFWYLGATIFVVLIWFLEVKIFKIKEIPFYSDFKFLIKKIKH